MTTSRKSADPSPVSPHDGVCDRCNQSTLPGHTVCFGCRGRLGAAETEPIALCVHDDDILTCRRCNV